MKTTAFMESKTNEYNSKIRKFPQDGKTLSTMSQRFANDNDFVKAIICLNRALLHEKGKISRREMLFELASLYGKIDNLQYSNEVLFQLLCESPHNDKAFLSLMMNITTSKYADKDLAEYYFNKCKNMFEEILVADLVDDDDQLSEMVGDGNALLDLLFDNEQKKKDFHVLGRSEKLHDILAQAYILLGNEKAEDAIVILNSAYQIKKLSKLENARICNALACCYFNLGNEELCSQHLFKADEFENNNVDCLVMMYAFSDKFKRPDVMNFCLDSLEKSDFKKRFDAQRIVTYLCEGKRFNAALDVAKKYLKLHPFDYEFNKFEGIIYFNLGYKEKARKIFLRQNNIFGKLCNARYYVYCIDIFSDLKFLSIERFPNNWVLLAKIYVSRSSIFLDLDDEQAKKMFAEQSFKDCLDWLFDVLLNISVTILIIKRLVNFDLPQINNWLNKKICQDSGIEVQIKIEIMTAILERDYIKSGKIDKTINYVYESRFDSFKIISLNGFEDIFQNLREGYFRASVVAKLCEQELLHLALVLKKVEKIMSENLHIMHYDSAMLAICLLETSYDSLPIFEYFNKVDSDENILKIDEFKRAYNDYTRTSEGK